MYKASPDPTFLVRKFRFCKEFSIFTQTFLGFQQSLGFEGQVLEFLRRSNIESSITGHPDLDDIMPATQLYVIKKTSNFELQVVRKAVPVLWNGCSTNSVSLIVNNSVARYLAL